MLVFLPSKRLSISLLKDTGLEKKGRKETVVFVFQTGN